MWTGVRDTILHPRARPGAAGRGTETQESFGAPAAGSPITHCLRAYPRPLQSAALVFVTGTEREIELFLAAFVPLFRRTDETRPAA